MIKLPQGIVRRLERFVESRIERKPDRVIGSPDAPYMLRWWLIPRNPLLNIYAHWVVRSDDDRALHDHPWWNLSIILSGAYIEVTRSRYRRTRGMLIRRTYSAGDVKLRGSRSPHRLELIDSPYGAFPTLTLFVTGPRLRNWGFHCPRGWVPWQLFTKPENPGEIGRGCE